MPKVKNLQHTVLVIPGGLGSGSLRLGPREEVDVEHVSDAVKRAESRGYVRIVYKGPAARKAQEDKK